MSRRDKAYLVGPIWDDFPDEVVFAPSKSIAIERYRKSYQKYYPSNPEKLKAISFKIARELTPYERWLFKDKLKEARLSSKPVQIPEYGYLEVSPEDWAGIPERAKVLDFYLKKKGITSENESEKSE